MLKNRLQKNNTKYHGIHITHNDGDAVGCALVLSYFHPAFDFQDNTYFCSIGSQDKKIAEIFDRIINGEEEAPKVIVVSDISISEESCKLLEDLSQYYGTHLHGFDHHKTNNLAENHTWWTVIKDSVYRKKVNNFVDISATLLMYDTYSMHEEGSKNYSIYETIRPIAEIISDYDTWTWRKYPGLWKTENFDADIIGIICSMLRPEKMFEHLLNHYLNYNSKDKMFPDLFYTLYDIEVTNRDSYLNCIKYKTRIFEHNGFGFGMFISENNYSNAAAEFLYNEYACIDIVIIIYPASKQIGFRTKRTDIDLGAIAKKYFNGGGHPSAAGARFDNDDDFVDFLKVYYIDTVPLLDYVKKDDE